AAVEADLIASGGDRDIDVVVQPGVDVDVVVTGEHVDPGAAGVGVEDERPGAADGLGVDDVTARAVEVKSLDGKGFPVGDADGARRGVVRAEGGDLLVGVGPAPVDPVERVGPVAGGVLGP